MNEKLVFLCNLALKFVWFGLPAIGQALYVNKDTADLLTNASMRNFAGTYSDFILGLLSIFMMIVMSIVGYFYPTPEYGQKPLPKPIQLLTSMVGGIVAFMYYIEKHGQISSAVIIWVGGVAFIAPATLHLVHAGAIKFGYEFFRLSDKWLTKIIKSFRKE